MKNYSEIIGSTVTIGSLSPNGLRPVLDAEGERIGMVRSDAGPVTMGEGTVILYRGHMSVRFGDGEQLRLIDVVGIDDIAARKALAKIEAAAERGDAYARNSLDQARQFAAEGTSTAADYVIAVAREIQE